MALFYHPITVSAAVLSTLAVIASPALAQRPPAQGHFLGDLCQGYNGVEGTCQTYFSCSSLQQDAETLIFNTFIERHAIGCNFERASDGLICCPKPACSVDEFICTDRTCIQSNLSCDGRPDCPDRSDELGCPPDCAANEFTCQDGSCIPNIERCNGLVDCRDGSDEEGCPQQDCEYDGSVYKHGEDDGCYYKCYNGTMKMMIFNPPTGNQCVGPFEIFEDNCYYFNHTEVTWCEARKSCVALGGDLATNNFNTSKAFYTANDRGSSTWIGVRANLWLNGQQPQQQQWEFGEPEAQDQCGWMGHGGLWDYFCDFTRPFICQLY